MTEEKRNKLPPWLKKRVPLNSDCKVNVCLSDLKLGTVCSSARCPNRLECYSRGRATFLLMGPSCTRTCGYCAVSRETPAPLEPDEPNRVAEAVKRLNLRHAVITSVTRDDLPDGGAKHFARTVAAVRENSPSTTIEILVPDFAGNENAWETCSDSKPDVFNHNVETVPRLYPTVRPQADYDLSLALLDFVKERHPKITAKSGIMLGLGEEFDEVLEVAEDLRGIGVDMITVGQYLQPKAGVNLPVERFVTPEEFAELENLLKKIGFPHVACSPFVRSSYNAEEALDSAKLSRRAK